MAADKAEEFLFASHQVTYLSVCGFLLIWHDLETCLEVTSGLLPGPSGTPEGIMCSHKLTKTLLMKLNSIQAHSLLRGGEAMHKRTEHIYL